MRAGSTPACRMYTIPGCLCRWLDILPPAIWRALGIIQHELIIEYRFCAVLSAAQAAASVSSVIGGTVAWVATVCVCRKDSLQAAETVVVGIIQAIEQRPTLG